jgi:hypothetical protein
MKAIKISLAVIVLATIAFFAIKGISGNTGNIGTTETPKNQFVLKIEEEVAQVSDLSDDKFSKDYYKEVMYHIEDYYKSERFGNTSSENDQWKENLTKNLYVAYSNKFTKQAYHVFKGSVWDFEKLKFIRSESQELRNSTLLERGSEVDKQLSEIQDVIKRYDVVVSFISANKSFSFSNNSLSAKFPISEAQDKISQYREYKRTNLGNTYLNNCQRLHDQLDKIPQIYFNAHVRYLNNKISSWEDMYSNYNSHADYFNNLYTPLKNEINVLSSNIYGVSDHERKYRRLINKWDLDNRRAYSHNY